MRVLALVVVLATLSCIQAQSCHGVGCVSGAGRATGEQRRFFSTDVVLNFGSFSSFSSVQTKSNGVISDSAFICDRASTQHSTAVLATLVLKAGN